MASQPENNHVNSDEPEQTDNNVNIIGTSYQVRVVYDFLELEGKEEMAVYSDEVITVHSHEDGWYFGEKDDGTTG